MRLQLSERIDVASCEFVVTPVRVWRAWNILACASVAAAATHAVLIYTSGLLFGAVLAGVLVVALLLAAKQVTSESITVLRGVGVVLSTRRRCWPAAAADRRFLDLQDIQAPIIHETLTDTQVSVHLAFLLHDRQELEIAFPELQPGLSMLSPLYCKLAGLVPGTSSSPQCQ